jgi:hypothetical protein
MTRSAAPVWTPEPNTTEAIFVVDLEYALPIQMVNSPLEPLVRVVLNSCISSVLGPYDAHISQRFRSNHFAVCSKVYTRRRVLNTLLEFSSHDPGPLGSIPGRLSVPGKTSCGVTGWSWERVGIKHTCSGGGSVNLFSGYPH